jgi:thymidylate synthase (FAD)
MILVKPSFQILAIMEPQPFASPLELIELAGRTCYKSEEMISNDSSKKFVKGIMKRGHESVIEHSAMTVKFICDRGVTHELVRHRLCSFSQESQRYVGYKFGCTFVIPPWVDLVPGEYFFNYDPNQEWNIEQWQWFRAMIFAENTYKCLIEKWTPQQARSVLPNSTKTEIVVTANFREWKHIFNLRCSKAAHPQMREIMIPLLKECQKQIPVIFDNITYEE